MICELCDICRRWGGNGSTRKHDKKGWKESKLYQYDIDSAYSGNYRNTGTSL